MFQLDSGKPDGQEGFFVALRAALDFNQAATGCLEKVNPELVLF